MANNGTPVSINGNNIQTDTIFVDEVTHQNVPVIDAKQYTLAHANQSAIPFISMPNRVVTFSGTLYADSVADTDLLIDTFRGYLGIGKIVNLDIGYQGGTRRYIGTVTKSDIKRPGGLRYAKFTIEFTCNYPFGYDTTSTSLLSATGRTASSYNDTVTIDANAPSQLSIVTITYSSPSGTGTDTVQWGNGGTGQVITVTGSWNNGDVLVIDCVNKEVRVNGILTDFSGAFPELVPGDNTLQYIDDLTSRTFNIDIDYTRAWL